MIIRLLHEPEKNFYFDLRKRMYILHTIINHIMWYDVYIQILEKEVEPFLGKDGKFSKTEFDRFYSSIIRFKPGLGTKTPWEERILPKEIETKIKLFFPS